MTECVRESSLLCVRVQALTIANSSEGHSILHVVDVKHYHQSHVQHCTLHQQPHEGHQPQVVQQDRYCCAGSL